ncbi:MAG: CopG family antitoxin [Chloroflexi bacterium]|nr:CopG family antitoxin [Chloroflexota bacterium]
MMQQNPKSTSRIPQFKSIQEAAEFWDTHSGVDFEDEFEDIDVEIASTRLKRALRLTLDDETMDALISMARKRKVNPDDLVRDWIGEKLSSETAEEENANGMILKNTERIAKNVIEILISHKATDAAKLLLNSRLSFRSGFAWDPWGGEPPTLTTAFIEVETHEVADAVVIVDTYSIDIASALDAAIDALGWNAITDYEYSRRMANLLNVRIRILPSDVYKGWRLAYWGKLLDNA